MIIEKWQLGIVAGSMLLLGIAIGWVMGFRFAIETGIDFIQNTDLAAIFEAVEKLNNWG